MTYDEMKRYIEGVAKSGIHLGLCRIEELLYRLSNPEKNLCVIHVAGTNGKGSFSTFISQILIESGYKVGRYISPTLYGYRERLQINHRWIAKETAAWLMTMVREGCEAMAADGFEYPTLFEIETAMAFLYFKQSQCDFVVLEAGMGGREDSTNVIEKPLLSVITSISLDHMAVLGRSIHEISEQKAGIIKEGCPVLVYEQSETALEVIRREAEGKHAFVTVADWKGLCIKKTGLVGQCFDYKDYKALEIRMPGVYQIYNAAAAVAAATVLRASGISISREAIYAGLKNAVWPGRFEVLSKNPLVIVDGAHNEGGAQALRESIETYFKNKKLIGLMGVFADKDYEKILGILLPYFKVLYTHKPEGGRGLISSALAQSARRMADKLGVRIQIIETETVSEAAELSAEAASPDDVILSFGSLSTIGQLSRYIKER